MPRSTIPPVPTDIHNGPTDARVPRAWANLTATTQKPEARIVWTDKNGAHELTITRSTTVGSSRNAEICVADSTVSRVHARITPKKDGVHIVDLGSTNGTYYGRARVWELQVLNGDSIAVGDTVVRIFQSPAGQTAQLWPLAQFGPLLGRSESMRELFNTLQGYAKRSTTVLIQGETGTGKELVARAIHEHSAFADGPFVTVDCGTLQRELAESKLFGHARGAFTGAVSDRNGAFLDAHGGTLFLDEIGELPLELQPMLLRALESSTVCRVGETDYRPFRARFICATHRDLLQMVNAGTFREDLYFRIAVLLVEVPPLRARREDIPLLLQHFLPRNFHLDLDPATTANLESRPWTGNVRQLRNFAHRVEALGLTLALEHSHEGRTPPARAPFPPLLQAQGPTGLSLPEMRERYVTQWERALLSDLLARHNGNVAAIAEEAGVSKGRIYRLIRDHGL